jgi:nitronate monooxygenase
MFKTRVTEKLGIQYPIVAGTMMHLSYPPFVAAASEAGCLGVLASAMWKTKEELRDAIQQVKSLTKKPFAVNLNFFPAMIPADNEMIFQVLVDEGVRIVETSGVRAPEEFVAKFKEAGITWIHKCVGVRFAKKAASIGADIVTVVGYENGGATGIIDIGTLVLIPATAQAVDIPVIGGGGITTGRALVAAMALGAEGVIMGTAFLMSEECPIHENIKKALIEAKETDTILIMRSIGFTHRVWKNQKALLIQEMEANKAPQEDVIKAAAGENDRRMYQTGDLTEGTMSCGQGLGFIKEIKPLKNIVEDIIKEAEFVRKRLCK